MGRLLDILVKTVAITPVVVVVVSFLAVMGMGSMVPPAGGAGSPPPPRDWITPAHWHALGVVESGGRDSAVGAAGEITRYQMLPYHWAIHARPGERPDHEPDARRVATQVWNEPVRAFEAAHGRLPLPDEAYALWHRPGSFRQAGYQLRDLPAIVRQRCRRFGALVREFPGDRKEAVAP